ncbi:MAG TPA: hypothetical protein VGM29_14090, partial [Polyangiaceae bacterium]
RALVWDETNTAAGLSVQYYSGIDPTSVFLYAQPDSTQPILEDSDGDGICDKIVDSALPFKQPLNGVPQQGNPFYLGNDGPIGNTCVAGVLTPSQTPNLCLDHASDMFRVIHRDGPAKDPAVWGIGDLTGLECTGGQWELPTTGAKDGWICLAAFAADKVGNKGVSPPLRVCMDNSQTATVPNCAAATAPSCVKNCTPPPGRWHNVPPQDALVEPPN